MNKPNHTSHLCRSTPQGVPAPVGNYSHVTKVPVNTEWYVLSGQIGVNAQGVLPATFNDQVQNTFSNIRQVLQSQGLTFADIIKVNVWSVEDIDWDYFYEEWEAYFGSVYPSMTIGYITALGLPEIKLEIEIWAGKQV